MRCTHKSRFTGCHHLAKYGEERCSKHRRWWGMRWFFYLFSRKGLPC
jgi:hypothetical protein